MANFDKYSKFRLVKIKSGLVYGQYYNDVYCNKTMKEYSNKRQVLLVYYDEKDGSYKDTTYNNFIWDSSMFDYYEPKVGDTVRIVDNLFENREDFPFGVSEIMERRMRDRVTIASISTTEKYDCQIKFKIEEDEGYNTWATPMFDWTTYISNEKYADDIDYECFVTLKDDVKPGTYYDSIYVENELSELEGQIFRVNAVYDDNTLSLRTYESEYGDYDVDVDSIHRKFFRKVNKDNIEELDYMASCISGDTQYVKYVNTYDKDKEYIFTTDDENYRIVNLTDDEKRFLESISKGDIFKVRKYLPEEKNEADYIAISKINDKSFDVTQTIVDLFFEEYELDVWWHFTDDDENEVDLTCPVKLHEQVKLGKFYDCNERIVYASDYFKDIIGQTLKATGVTSIDNDLKVVKCKLMLMGDTIGQTYMIPLCMLVNIEEDLAELRVPTLKPGNLAIIKKGLKLGIRYKNALTNTIEECISPYNDCILKFYVVSSDQNITKCKVENDDGTKDQVTLEIPTMFLNLAIRGKGDDKEVLLRPEIDDDLYSKYDDLRSEIEEKSESKNIKNESRGNEVMKNLGLGNVMSKMFGEVGIVKDGSLALTLTGKVAVKRKDGDFVRWDCNGEVMENQGELIFPGSEKFMILMPSTTVEVGDIIKNSNKYYQVLEKKVNGSLKTVNFETGHCTTILKETNLFNMNFYTKVVSFMTGFGGNGVGGDGTQTMNPMMFALLTGDDDKEMNMTELMMLSSMFGGQQTAGMNPMMMLMMLKGDKEEGKSDMMETMMMASMMGGMNGGVNPFGAMFGQPQVTAPVVEEPVELKKVDSEEVIQLKTMVESQSKALETALAELAKAKKEKPASAKKADKNASK